MKTVQLDKAADRVNETWQQAGKTAQEQLENVANREEIARLAERKDQVVTQIQEKYDDSWVQEQSQWIIMATAVIGTVMLLAYFLGRQSSGSKSQESS